MSNKVIDIGKNQENLLSTDEIYVDVSMISTPFPRTDGYRIANLVNVNAVLNSLDNIFSWIPGERILNPQFGNELRKILYDGLTDLTRERVVSEINRCVSKWEPRVSILEVLNVSTLGDTEDNTITLNIVYTINGLDRIFNKMLKYNRD